MAVLRAVNALGMRPQDIDSLTMTWARTEGKTSGQDTQRDNTIVVLT